MRTVKEALGYLMAAEVEFLTFMGYIPCVGSKHGTVFFRKEGSCSQLEHDVALSRAKMDAAAGEP